MAMPDNEDSMFERVRVIQMPMNYGHKDMMTSEQYSRINRSLYLGEKIISISTMNNDDIGWVILHMKTSLSILTAMKLSGEDELRKQ